MEIILLSVACVLSLANLIVLVFLAAFLVRLRGFVADAIAIMTGMDEDESDELDESDEAAELSRAKTWDQKYEEELDVFQRRTRERGLVDLD